MTILLSLPNGEMSKFKKQLLRDLCSKIGMNYMRNLKEVIIEGTVIILKELTIKQIKKLAVLVFGFANAKENKELSLDMSLYEKVINLVPDCIYTKNKEGSTIPVSVVAFENFTFSEAEEIFNNLLEVNEALVKKLKRFGMLKETEKIVKVEENN